MKENLKIRSESLKVLLLYTDIRPTSALCRPLYPSNGNRGIGAHKHREVKKEWYTARDEEG